jgi:hypothetical protein
MDITFHAFTKEDFTDNRIVSFFEMNNDFSFEEYSNLINSIDVNNERSREIIKLLVDFHSGILCPEKCNASEPINRIFNPLSIQEPVKWLSQPGSAFFFIKKHGAIQFEGFFENHRFAPIWIDKKATALLKPTVPIPTLLGEIKMAFNKEKLEKSLGLSFFSELIEEVNKKIRIEKYIVCDQNQVYYKNEDNLYQK